MRLILLAAMLVTFGAATALAEHWSPDEKQILRSLWIGSLEALPPDPSNKYADNPKALALGHRLFFDVRLSSNGLVSCATCHEPARSFTDGKVLAEGVGTTGRHAPTIIGMAYSPWFFWDGRADSQWSQALGPLEAAVEHGGTRTQYVKLILSDSEYRSAYEAIFGALPTVLGLAQLPDRGMPSGDAAVRASWNALSSLERTAISRIFANLGKAIAAYERRIVPGESRFDRYVAAVLSDDPAAGALFTPDEFAGLKIFIGRGNCTQCHNGPMLTNNAFHNTGAGAKHDLGRAQGVQDALKDAFNCAGPFSDAGADGCGELSFAKTEGIDIVAAFKSPTLRNIAETAPYMHNGQFASLRSVLDHYKRAPKAAVGQSELRPLNLSESELQQLERFLLTLSAPLDVPDALLAAPR